LIYKEREKKGTKTLGFIKVKMWWGAQVKRVRVTVRMLTERDWGRLCSVEEEQGREKSHSLCGGEKDSVGEIKVEKAFLLALPLEVVLFSIMLFFFFFFGLFSFKFYNF
jgi:hypothetical protein